jgi:membrane-associated phospholipid phosphatase
MRTTVWTILILIAGTVAAFALDMPAYHFVKDCIIGKNWLPKQVVYGFQDFAQTIPPLAIAWLVWRLDPRQGRYVVLRMVLAFIMAGAVTGVGKLAVGRHRPEYFKGQTWQETWIDVGLSQRDSKQSSFFSGHSAAAFTMATILSAYYPPVRPVVYTLATGCAASRVVTEQHWTSDVYIGSLSGIALGWAFLPARLRRVRRDKGLLQGKLTG